MKFFVGYRGCSYQPSSRQHIQSIVFYRFPAERKKRCSGRISGLRDVKMIFMCEQLILRFIYYTQNNLLEKLKKKFFSNFCLKEEKDQITHFLYFVCYIRKRKSFLELLKKEITQLFLLFNHILIQNFFFIIHVIIFLANH